MNERIDMNQSEATEEVDAPALSERTPIRLGLVILAATAVFSAVIWNATNAAKVNAKLDNLTSLVSKAVGTAENTDRSLNVHISEDQKKWTELESRISVVERSGSEKTRDMEKELNLLRRDFEVHKAVAPITGR